MIAVRNLSKKYGESVILDGFSHEFRPRGITCLWGASGSGKSTLFNLLAGFDREYQGEISVAGQNIAQLSQDELSNYRTRCIGFVFQDYHLLPGYTVLDNILLASQLLGHEEAESKCAALELLQRLGIREKATEKIENLSGGEKQRVAIARALTGNPAVILADEPTGALDRKTASEIMELFQQIAQERPVLIITHDSKICAYAEEVLTIEDGKCRVLKRAAALPSDPIVPVLADAVHPSMFKRALYHFRTHVNSFMGLSLTVTAVTCAVFLSLSSQNVIKEKISAFEAKNTAFAWGQVVLEEEELLDDLCGILEQSPHIQHWYVQYEIPESELLNHQQRAVLSPTTFGSIAQESVTMGSMPRKDEIAVTPSLAKKLSSDIGALIGTQLVFRCGIFSKSLIISGIFNGSFDTYYLDSDTEQELYDALQLRKSPRAVAYQADGFYHVLDAEEQLLSRGYHPVTASKQVESLKLAFNQLQLLFFLVSALIVIISLLICVILLMKTARMRAREVGLLMALGYHHRQIKEMLLYESAMISVSAALLTAAIFLGGSAVSAVSHTSIIVSVPQLTACMAGTIVLGWMITALVNAKLLRTDPAQILTQ